MKLTYEDYDQLSVVTLRGELTGDESERLRELIHDRMQRDIRDFVLNLEEAETIDSAGLETMLWIQDTSAECLGQVRLAGVPEGISEVMRVTRLSPRFDCHATIESAIRSLR